jgi:hypothetical protein
LAADLQVERVPKAVPSPVPEVFPREVAAGAEASRRGIGRLRRATGPVDPREGLALPTIAGGSKATGTCDGLRIDKR